MSYHGASLVFEWHSLLFDPIGVRWISLVIEGKKKALLARYGTVGLGGKRK